MSGKENKKKLYQLSEHSFSGYFCVRNILTALYNSWRHGADGHTMDGPWKTHQHNNVRRRETNRGSWLREGPNYALLHFFSFPEVLALQCFDKLTDYKLSCVYGDKLWGKLWVWLAAITALFWLNVCKPAGNVTLQLQFFVNQLQGRID